ncbi:hypothetical protein JCM8097_004121 [Rhodosporidiobolus ruineniae]
MPAAALPLTLFDSPDSINPAFVCPECHGVLSSPVISCSDYEHTVCSQCRNANPICRQCANEGRLSRVEEGGQVGKPVKALERAIGELKIKCRDGCGWTDKLVDSATYAQDCPLRPLPCPNAGCAHISLGAVALREHLKDPKEGCPLQLVACKRSTVDVDVLGRRTKVEARCWFARGEKEAHRAKCEWHRCAENDCPTRGTLAFLSTHTDRCAAVSDLLVEYDVLEDEHAQLQEEHETLVADLAHLEGDRDDLADMLDDAEEVEADLTAQVIALEAEEKKHVEDCAALQKDLDEVRATSCKKDAKIDELEGQLAKEIKKRWEVEGKLEALKKAQGPQQQQQQQKGVKPVPSSAGKAKKPAGGPLAPTLPKPKRESKDVKPKKEDLDAVDVEPLPIPPAHAFSSSSNHAPAASSSSASRKAASSTLASSSSTPSAFGSAPASSSSPSKKRARKHVERSYSSSAEEEDETDGDEEEEDDDSDEDAHQPPKKAARVESALEAVS